MGVSGAAANCLDGQRARPQDKEAGTCLGDGWRQRVHRRLFAVPSTPTVLHKPVHLLGHVVPALVAVVIGHMVHAVAGIILVHGAKVPGTAIRIGTQTRPDAQS